MCSFNDAECFIDIHMYSKTIIKMMQEKVPDQL